MSIRRCGRPLAAAVLVLFAILPAWAGDDPIGRGDGAGYDNPDLLRAAADGCAHCLAGPPPETYDLPVDLDWRLSLRGAYVQTPSGSYFAATALPSLTLRHDFLRGAYEVTANAEITRSTVEELHLGALGASFSGTYRLDEVTALSGSATLSASRDSVTGLGVSPSVLRPPLTLSGTAEGELTRDFGPVVVTGRLGAGRTMFEPTLMTGPVLVDNSHQNNWRGTTGIRLGYRLTPILTAFIDGSAGYQAYDAASPTYLVKLDAADIQGRIGLSGEWTSVLSAEASIGYGLRRFADPTLGEAAALLYDASVTFRPDETLELRGAFTTAFDAPGPDTAGTARLQHTATASLGYRVNTWLSLRATASGYHAQLIGTSDTEQGYSAGIGADYLINRHATLSADYAYTSSHKTPAPAEDEHRVTLGITFSR